MKTLLSQTVVSTTIAVGMTACSGTEDQACPDDLHTIHVHAVGGPSTVAFREGSGPWQRLSVDEGVGSFCTANIYEVLMVCDGASGHSTQRQAATFREKDDVRMSECMSGRDPQRVSVSGRVEQESQVWIGSANVGRWGQGAWDYELLVRRGKHDMVVTNAFSPSDGNGLAFVRRGLDVNEPTRLEPIDLLRDGLPMTSLALTIENLLSGDSLSSRATLITNRDKGAQIAVSEAQSPSVLVLPDSLVTDDDQQFVAVFAGGVGRQRYVSRPLNAAGGSPAPFLLPPLPTKVAFESSPSARVTWPELESAEYSRLEVQIVQGVAPRNIVGFSATQGWMRARNATAIEFDPAFPEYDPGWAVDVRLPYAWTFSIVQVGSDVTGSTISEVVTP